MPAEGNTWARLNPDAVEGRTCLAEPVRNVGTDALPVLHEFDALGDGAGSRRRDAVGQWSSAMASLSIFCVKNYETRGLQQKAYLMCSGWSLRGLHVSLQRQLISHTRIPANSQIAVEMTDGVLTCGPSTESHEPHAARQPVFVSQDTRRENLVVGQSELIHKEGDELGNGKHESEMDKKREAGMMHTIFSSKSTGIALMYRFV
jgi:hypothetical protein